MSRRRRGSDMKIVEDFIMLFVYLFFGVFILAGWLIKTLIESVGGLAGWIQDNDCPEGVLSAEVIERIQWTKEEYKHSGMSVGLNGNPRFYFRTKDVPYKIEVKFLVKFEDGTVKTLSATEGSERYNYLMSYVRIKEEQKKRAEEFKKSGPAVFYPKSMKSQKPKTEKHYVNTAFEVSPNEYNLSIQYPSCQMEITDDGTRKLHVRMEVHYDQNVKGVRNRRIVCAAIDSQGRMTDKMVTFDRLDTSGQKLVDMTFWKNVEFEPVKIIVDIEPYN